MSDTVKQQHYLPNKSLLSYFTDDQGKLNVYRFGADGVQNFYDTATHFQVYPKNMAKEGYIYETPELPTNTLEKILATIEGAYLRVMEDKIQKGLLMTEDDESVVRLYVEMLQGRVPAYRDHMNDFIDRIEETGRQMYKAHDVPISEDWTGEMADVRERFFAMNIMSRLEIHPMQWNDLCILTIDEHARKSMYFMLADNPVSMKDFEGGNNPYGSVHPSHKAIETIVPIAHDKAVFLNNAGITGYREISYFEVDEINLRTMSRAKEFIIANQPVAKDYYGRSAFRHHPISFVLKLIKLPRGRMAKQLEWIKKQEKKARKV
jgi:hypothetical protein